MAELASGAVSSLLSVIRNEMQLLGGVQDDVLFIKEEMESMKSFLAHLAKTTPPGVEHDEQVRTWMNQVRLLAQDSNTCIDHYLYRGNPDIHRARGGLRHYFWWVPWFVQKTVAQHRAAYQLRKLKERARDVGERRSRYGVEVPEKKAAALRQSLSLPSTTGATTSATAAASAPSSTGGAAVGGGDDEDDDDGDDNEEVADATDHAGRKRAIFKPPTLDDYVEGKLSKWIEEVAEEDIEVASSIAIVAPDNDQDAIALARETLAVPGMFYNRIVLVDIPAVHFSYHPLRPRDILYYILWELKPEDAKSQPQLQGTGQGEGEEQQSHDGSQLIDFDDRVKRSIYHGKEKLISKIWGNILDMVAKLEKIKSNIQARPLQGDQLQQNLEQMKNINQLELDQKPLDVLLQLLLRSAAAAAQQDQVKNKAMDKLAGWYNYIIEKAAEKLKEQTEVEEKEEATRKHTEHMEIEENGETTKQMKVEEAAKKQQKAPLYLHKGQYERILREVFPVTSNSKKNLQAKEQDTNQATNSTTITVEAQIKEMVHKVTEVLQQLQEELCAQGQITEDVYTEIDQKIEKIKQGIKKQMEIKWIVDKIKGQLNDEMILIILHIDDERINKSTWEETRYGLTLMPWQLASVLIVTDTRSIQQAKEYCYPPQRNPIDYSLVGLYHDTVLKLTSHQNNDQNHNTQIIHNILEECKPHEFCMKIFTHALHANPKRSNEELLKLHHSLQLVSKKSFVSIAKKMFRFSYNDLSKEYKSCLLYLAIFPPHHNVRRSTLIGRWVIEGLITKEDWPTSVHEAELCFDALVDRWLVFPGHIGATGKVKSCVVGNLFHRFITKIARKQHIVLTRLSLHLARHFSIFNDVQLGSSDDINKFFKRLPESSPWSRLKVLLDLEGCTFFHAKNRNLKDICNNILLLKYLSLRRTDVKQLPTELNNLHELEVLDICQTEVPSSAIKHLLLLKLKRLLAGYTYQTPGTGATMSKDFSSVQIPSKIEKMVNMEVLSNVKASQTGHELKGIRKLWQLRKLGVVIDDKDSHLENLLRAIGDLHECLQSLSITLLPIAGSEGTSCSGGFLLWNNSSRGLPAADIGSSLKCPPKVLETLSITGTTGKVQLLKKLLDNNVAELSKITLSTAEHEGTPSSQELPAADTSSPKLKNPPKLLESLSISGTTQRVHLLGLLSRDGDSNKLAKVTLSKTMLIQENLKVLAKLPRLQCVRFQYIACNESVLTFKKGEFKKLKYLLVEGPNFDEIMFEKEAACELGKMVLSSTNIRYVSGVDGLLKLEEIELNHNHCGRLLSSFDNANQIAKLTLRGTFLEQVDLQILAKKPNIRNLLLLEESCDISQSQITFNKDEFPKLNHLIVDCPTITKIVFDSDSVPKLEKIRWSSSTSLSGIDKLPRLKELEFKGVPDELQGAINKNKNKPKLKYIEPEIQDQAGEQDDDDKDARFSFCLKIKV